MTHIFGLTNWMQRYRNISTWWNVGLLLAILVQSLINNLILFFPPTFDNDRECKLFPITASWCKVNNWRDLFSIKHSQTKTPKLKTSPGLSAGKPRICSGAIQLWSRLQWLRETGPDSSLREYSKLQTWETKKTILFQLKKRWIVADKHSVTSKGGFLRLSHTIVRPDVRIY